VLAVNEGVVQQPDAGLAPHEGGPPLLTAAIWLHARLGGRGPPARGCRRHWTSQRLSRTSVPLTGATALQSDTPWVSTTMLAFPRALAAEADDVAPRRFAFESTVQAVGIN
jgi:hypothetical protein